MSMPLVSQTRSQSNITDSVAILSDKAYRDSENGVFEALGNVVITSEVNTIYGQRATFYMQSQDVRVEGNVRYIGPEVIIFARELTHNTKSRELELKDALLEKQSFNIRAKKIKRLAPKHYLATQAEFTTCSDCAESWLVRGEEVDIELGQYVRIKHAQVLIKGVTFFYVPYLVLPIKDERESGVLFPWTLARPDMGTSFGLPLYLTLGPSADMTFTPASFGRRGVGMDYEFRKVFHPEHWFEWQSRALEDHNLTRDKKFRHFSTLEHHNVSSENLTHHTRVQGTSDFLFLNDFSEMTNPLINNSSLGLEHSTSLRRPYGQWTMELFYENNLLQSTLDEFDSSYVQQYPKIQFQLRPQILLKDSFIDYVSYDFDFESSVFRQNRFQDLNSLRLRNAHRTLVNQYLNFSWINNDWGRFSSQLNVGHRYYEFLNKDSFFHSSYARFKTEFSFKLEKTFGVAYRHEVLDSEMKKLNHLNLKKNQSQSSLTTKNQDKEKTSSDKESPFGKGLMGDFQSFNLDDKIETQVISSNSYRHTQDISFIHHYLFYEDLSGDQVFENQIQDLRGLFDYKDILIDRLHEMGPSASRSTMPQSNSLELKWSHEILRKTPLDSYSFNDQEYLRDHFRYDRIFTLNASQGIFLDRTDNQLARLLVDSSFSIGTFSLSANYLYFHEDQTFLGSFNISKGWDLLKFGLGYQESSLDQTQLQTSQASLQFLPIDSLGFSLIKHYDFKSQEELLTIYQIDIMPLNNCWIFALNYRESLIDDRFSFNFIFNLGDNDEYKNYRSQFFNLSRVQI